MKKKLTLLLLTAAIALSGAIALWAQDQKPACDKCPTAQQTKVAAAKTCICPDCPEGKRDPACTCGCRTKGRQCDLKGCDGCAKKEKSQPKPCCDPNKAK